MPIASPLKEKTEMNAAHIRRICFVCTGNTCRSPMAEAYYNHIHAKEPTRACSAGIAAHEGHPINTLAVEVLRESGIVATESNDYPSHTARMLTREIVDASDLIVCMSPTHAMAVLCAFPDCVLKITDIGDIADPWGGDIDDYRRAFREIKEAIDRGI